MLQIFVVYFFALGLKMNLAYNCWLFVMCDL